MCKYTCLYYKSFFTITTGLDYPSEGRTVTASPCCPTTTNRILLLQHTIKKIRILLIAAHTGLDISCLDTLIEGTGCLLLNKVKSKPNQTTATNQQSTFTVMTAVT